MAVTAEAEKIPVRFKPAERHFLLDYLGPDHARFSGLGLAVAERPWQVCWMGREELRELSARMANQNHMAAGGRPSGPLAKAARRIARAAADCRTAQPGQAGQAELAGLAAAGWYLGRPGERLALPAELAVTTGFFQGGGRRLAPAARPTSLESLLERNLDQPLAALGGLSASRFGRLVSAGWLEEQGPLVLKSDWDPCLPEDDILLPRARLLLRLVGQHEPLAADSHGRLPMSLVLALLESPVWTVRAGHGVWDCRGLPNEDGIEPISAMRAMLQQAGLLVLTGGRFELSPRGQSLRRPESAGQLFRMLFAARLRNGAGFDPADEDGEKKFHRAMAYHLYRLSIFPGEEITLDQALAWAALPSWLYRQGAQEHERSVSDLVESRLLAPLLAFGLLRHRRSSNAQGNGAGQSYRLTPALRRLLHFDV